MSVQHPTEEFPIPACGKDCGWVALVKAVADLAGAADLADIIDIVRLTARDISGADGVCFVLRDGERCHYVEENAVSPLWKGKRFPLETCISGWSMLNDRSAVVPDIYADARIPHDAYRPTFVKSLIVVPVRIGKPVAAIGFYWAKLRDFPQAELALIEALGRSTSAALGAVQARERLRDSERRLSMALDAGGLGAFELAGGDDVVVATRALKIILGRDPEAPLSRQEFLTAMHPDDREAAERLLSTGIGGGQTYRCGGKQIEIFARLDLDSEGLPNRVTGVVRDITEQIVAKERLESLSAELLRASRLTDLGAMASALAHELNQPLAAGGNYLKAAERLMAKDPEKALDAIGKAGGQFVRTKEIIQRIRGFVGQAGAIKTPEAIEQVCYEVMELTRISTRHAGVQVYLKAEAGLPKIPMDKVQIQQVLVNLLRNALEALDGRAKRHITLAAKRLEDAVEISVSDTGPGLDPEIAAHLFQPFHSTKEGGMGVGLSLCRKIVETHGGRLSYETSSEGGAVFRFTLPIEAV